MATINVYINDSLKAEMAPCGTEVNWSRVASEAFERAISDWARRQGVPPIWLNGIDKTRITSTKQPEGAEQCESTK